MLKHRKKGNMVWQWEVKAFGETRVFQCCTESGESWIHWRNKCFHLLVRNVNFKVSLRDKNRQQHKSKSLSAPLCIVLAVSSVELRGCSAVCRLHSRPPQSINAQWHVWKVSKQPSFILPSTLMQLFLPGGQLHSGDVCLAVRILMKFSYVR